MTHAHAPKLSRSPDRVSVFLLLASFLVVAPSGLAAQEGEAGPPRPEADPTDVADPEALVAAVYDVISGPAGEERDWDRFRSLFVPDARLLPSWRTPGGDAGHRVLTTEEYVEGASRAFADSGFHEREIHARTERYGDIAHVFSTYESRRSPGEAPFARGINSFQLWFDGERWWVVTILWHAEHEGAPIPERYGG